MADATKTVELLVVLRDLASAQLAELQGQVAATTDKMKAMNDSSVSMGQAFSNFGEAAGKAGFVLTAGVTVPIVAVGAAAVKMASDFQTATERLVTLAGVPESAIAGVRTQLIQLAQEVPYGPTALANAMYEASSAGLDLSTALQVTKYSAEAAAMSGADLNNTENTLIATMKTGVAGTQDAGKAMGMLTAIVGAGNMKFQDLNNALGSGLLATAAQVKVPLDQIGAAMAYMTDRSVPATKAATSLQRMLILMVDPSVAATKALSAIGDSGPDVTASLASVSAALKKANVTQAQLGVDLQTHGLTYALTDLQNHLVSSGVSTEEASAIMAKAFGGSRSSATVMMLTQNLGQLQAKQKQIDDGTKNFQQNWKDAQNTLGVQWQQTVASVEAQLVKLGTIAMPGVSAALKDITGYVVGFLSALSKLSPQQDEMIVKILALIAVVGPLLIVVSKVIKVLSAFHDMGKATIDIIKGMPKAWSDTQKAFSDMQSTIGTVAGKIGDFAGAVKDGIGGAIKFTGDRVSDLKGYISDAGSAMADGASNAASAAKGWISAATDTAKGWATTAATAVTDFAKMAAAATANAVKAAGAWIIEAHNSEYGLMGSIARMIGLWVRAAVNAYINAVKASAAWIVNAAKATAAWVANTAVMIAQWTVAAAQATVKGAIAAGAWTVSAAQASAAWLAQTPGMLARFAVWSVQASINGAKASAAWVVSAITSSAAWIAQTSIMVVKFIGLAAVSVAQAALASAAWVAQTAGLIIYHTVVDGVKLAITLWTGAQWLLNAAMDANPVGALILAITALIIVAVLVVTHWKAVAAFFSTLWSDIVGSLSGIINWIKGAFGGAGSWLINVGHDIIMGLWNGIAGMAGWLGNKIMGFIKATIPGPVLKVLGIHSPSTVFAEIGKNTMLGFHTGFQSQASATLQMTTAAMQQIIGGANSAVQHGIAMNHPGYNPSSLSYGANGAYNTNNNQNNSRTFAPQITINMGGTTGTNNASYTAQQMVLQMQHQALFT